MRGHMIEDDLFTPMRDREIASLEATIAVLREERRTLLIALQTALDKLPQPRLYPHHLAAQTEVSDYMAARHTAKRRSA